MLSSCRKKHGRYGTGTNSSRLVVGTIGYRHLKTFTGTVSRDVQPQIFFFIKMLRLALMVPLEIPTGTLELLNSKIQIQNVIENSKIITTIRIPVPTYLPT